MPVFSNLNVKQFKEGLDAYNQDANAFYTNSISEDQGISALEGEAKQQAVLAEKRAFLALCMADAIPSDYFAGGVVNNKFNWNPTNNEMIDEIAQGFNGNVADFSDPQLLMFNTYLNTLEGDEKQALDDVLEYMNPGDMWQQRKVIANALLGERLIPAPNIQQVPEVNAQNQIVAVEKMINKAEYDQGQLAMTDYKGRLESFLNNAKDGKPIENPNDMSIFYEDEEEINEIKVENEKVEDAAYPDANGAYPITRKLSFEKLDMIFEFGKTTTPLKDKKDFLLSILFSDYKPEEFKQLCDTIQASPDAQKAIDDIATYATTEDISDPEKAKPLKEHIASYAAYPSPIHSLIKDIDRMKEAAEKNQQQLEMEEDDDSFEILKDDAPKKVNESENKEQNQEIINIVEAPDLDSDYIQRIEFGKEEDPKQVLMSVLRDPDASQKEKVSYLVAYFFHGKDEKEYFKALQNLDEDSKIKVEKDLNQMQNHKYCNLVSSLLEVSNMKGFEEKILDEESKNLMCEALTNSAGTSLNAAARMSRRVQIIKEAAEKEKEKEIEAKKKENDKEEDLIINTDSKQNDEIKINSKEEKEEKDPEKDAKEDDKIEELIVYPRSKNIGLYFKELDRFNTSRLSIFKNESDKHMAVRLAAERMIQVRQKAEQGQNGKMSAVFEKEDERNKTILATNYLSAAQELNYHANVYIKNRNPLTFAGADRYGGARSLEKFSNTDTKNALALIDKYGLDLKKIQIAIAKHKLETEAENLQKLDFDKIKNGDKAECTKYWNVLISSLAANATINNLEKGADPKQNDYYTFRKQMDQSVELGHAIYAYITNNPNKNITTQYLQEGAKTLISELKNLRPNLNYDQLSAPKGQAKVQEVKNNSLKM